MSRHAAIEEQLFCPVARATVPGTEDMASESLEEHHVVKWLLDEVSSLDVENERFDAKTTVLIENVRHHVEEEEGEFFPKVRDVLGRNDLNDSGDAMAKAEESAPTHPHTRWPDTSPAPPRRRRGRRRRPPRPAPDLRLLARKPELGSFRVALRCETTENRCSGQETNASTSHRPAAARSTVANDDAKQTWGRCCR